jgi:5-formyltetrahydrofolate cyclo-ligase
VTTALAKAALRRAAAARRDALTDRAERSAAIVELVMALPDYSAAAAIHCFLPIRSEVDTRPLVLAAMAAGKAVAVPVVGADGVLAHSWITGLDTTAFARGQLGTARPHILSLAQPGEWGLTIVPLLAFDRSGYRLGYGKGHYDRLLAEGVGPTVGVAFACQEEPELPREAHDRPLAMIVTEAELIVPRRT